MLDSSVKLRRVSPAVSELVAVVMSVAECEVL